MSRRGWTAWVDQQAAAAPTVARPAAARTTFQRASKPKRPSSRALQVYRSQELADIQALDAAVPTVQELVIQPVPKPRMTQADRWAKRPCVQRYRAYCDELRLRGVRLPHAYRLEFVLPMPASWSEATKSAMDGQPHLVRPDTSNLIKAVEDALVPRDERLHDIQGSKVWGRAGTLRVIKITRPNLGSDGDVVK